MGLMPMQVREVIRLLEKHEWVEMRSRGSHLHFKHPNQALVITVPGNEGKELAPGTLNARQTYLKFWGSARETVKACPFGSEREFVRRCHFTRLS